MDDFPRSWSALQVAGEGPARDEVTCREVGATPPIGEDRLDALTGRLPAVLG
ncbi:hypothetical protein [Amycolatopsis granulosa]|uniref:hypothetical protein n=1 Tax=Amycolatopsis granulosa TaxID=185684 RepID=UPI00141E930F|nr:hypothetical protein [Amycolatopsis granulosa]NIH83599.1 hypothetical protein [Amycolatopsis granulosa]